MAQISVELSREIARRMAEGSYQSEEELLKDALSALDERNRLEERLLKALNSGEGVEITPGFWEEKRRRLQERHARR